MLACPSKRNNDILCNCSAGESLEENFHMSLKNRKNINELYDASSSSAGN